MRNLFLPFAGSSAFRLPVCNKAGLGLLLASGALFLQMACQVQRDPAPGALYDRFSALAVADTFYLRRDTVGGIPLSYTLLSAAVGDSLLAVIHPDSDTATTEWQAMGRIPWDAHHEACLLKASTSWWVHGGLLLYDKRVGRFAFAMQAVLLYGGDGSQVLKESLLLDFDGDGDRDLATYELYRALVWEGEEAVEKIERRVELHTWTGSGFASEVPTDSLRWLEGYEIEW